MTTPPTFTVNSAFEPQQLLVGEVAPVYCAFVGSLTYTMASCTFTILSYGAIQTGYNAIAANIAVDSSGMIWNANCIVDGRSTATHPLAPGEYVAQFAGTDQYSNIWIAEQMLTIVAAPAATEIQQVILSGALG